MTEPTDNREQRPYRRHPLLNNCLVVIDGDGIAFAGEVIDIIRTNSRHGDALMVLEFDRADLKPIVHWLVSISDIASLDGADQVVIFEGPHEALAYIAAHTPGPAPYVLLDDEPPG